jgi:hypothetical protein
MLKPTPLWWASNEGAKCFRSRALVSRSSQTFAPGHAVVPTPETAKDEREVQLTTLLAAAGADN